MRAPSKLQPLTNNASHIGNSTNVRRKNPQVFIFSSEINGQAS